LLTEGGATAVTVTVAFALAVPPAPLQASEYVDTPAVAGAAARRLLAHLGSCPDVLLGFATGSMRGAAEFNAVLVGDGVWDGRVAHALDIAFIGAETGLHVFGSRANLTVSDWTELDVESFRLIARPVSHSILKAR
jgi:hypothetical protein